MKELIYEKWSDIDEHIYLRKETVSGKMRNHMLPHYHNAIECAIVVNGSYMAHVNTEDYILRAGDILFIDSMTPHFFTINGEAEVYAVVINLPMVKSMNLKGTFPQFICDKVLFEKLLEICLESETKWEESDQQFKAGFAYMFLGRLLQHIKIGKIEGSKSRNAFLDIMSYVEEHYREEITLSQLADKFGYAPSYFSRTFNEFAGINLREYVNRLRIAEALKIKKINESLPWSDIALKVGYISLNTFYRAYEKYADEKQIDLTEIKSPQDEE